MGDFNKGLTPNNLAMIGYTGQTKLDPALAEAVLNRKKEQTTNPAPKIQKTETDSFVSSLTKATSNNNGKFDIDQAAINFGKGFISPLTQMFSSPKNFIMGAGMIAGATVLTIATGGAILPFMVALGVGTGAVQAGTGLYKFATAKNGDEREKAFFDAGAATSTIAGSIAGAKPALNTYNAAASAGIKVSNNSFIAAGQCIMNAKGSAGASINIARTSGMTNLSTPLATLKSIGDASKGKSKAVESDKPELKTQSATENNQVSAATTKETPAQAQNTSPNSSTQTTDLASKNKHHSNHIKLKRKHQQNARINKTEAEKLAEASKRQAENKVNNITQAKAELTAEPEFVKHAREVEAIYGDDFELTKIYADDPDMVNQYRILNKPMNAKDAFIKPENIRDIDMEIYHSATSEQISNINQNGFQISGREVVHARQHGNGAYFTYKPQESYRYGNTTGKFHIDGKCLTFSDDAWFGGLKNYFAEAACYYAQKHRLNDQQAVLLKMELIKRFFMKNGIDAVHITDLGKGFPDGFMVVYNTDKVKPLGVIPQIKV